MLGGWGIVWRSHRYKLRGIQVWLDEGEALHIGPGYTVLDSGEVCVRSIFSLKGESLTLAKGAQVERPMYQVESGGSHPQGSTDSWVCHIHHPLGICLQMPLEKCLDVKCPPSAHRVPWCWCYLGSLWSLRGRS